MPIVDANSITYDKPGQSGIVDASTIKYDEAPPPDSNVIPRTLGQRLLGGVRGFGQNISNIPGQLATGGREIADIYQKTPETRNPITNLEMILKMGGKAIETGGNVAGGIISQAAKPFTENAYLPESGTPTQAGQRIQNLLAKGQEKLGVLEQAHPRATEDVKAALQWLSLLPVGRAAEEVAPEVKVGIEGTAQLAKKAVTGVKELVKPTPTKEAALEQVLQTKGKNLSRQAYDLTKGKQALGTIDTSGIKTYTELHQRLNEAIPDLAQQVDIELAKDPKAYKLEELLTTGKSTGGAEVQQNFVKTALDNLKELYTKTNDPISAKNIDELLEEANTNGLTKKEVNDLARKYNVEFGDKAFNKKTGEAFTSVNSQTYENVRKGLKSVARKDMSPAAKELDAKMESILNTRRLIDSNAAAVTKLRQRLTEGGLFEKIGGKAMNAIDMLTLGGAKGFVQKLFPRNLGYKTKNWLDLEKSLERNLKIINKANAAKTNKEMRQALFELRKALPPAPIEAGYSSVDRWNPHGENPPQPIPVRVEP